MQNDDCKLPSSFHELISLAEPLKLKINNSVLDPVLLFDNKGDAGIKVELAGKRIFRGECTYYKAPSIFHDYVLREGIVYPLPNGIVRELAELLGGYAKEYLSIADIIKIARLDDTGFDLDFSPSVFCSGKESAGSDNFSYHAPDTLNANLYPYQTEGVKWIVSNLKTNSGVILADEMGLGKTIQVIASLLELSPTDIEPVLIICPTSLITNWIMEINKFAPSLSISVHRGPYRSGVVSSLKSDQIILTTYDTAVIDELLIGAVNWKCIVCDEAQALKNPESARRQSISRLNGQFLMLMTGTPVETSLLDMWSLIDLAIPNILGSQYDFIEEFPNNEESAERLNNLTASLILRRMVSDVAKDLPDRIDIELPISLNEQLEYEYEAIRKETLNEYGLAGGLVATTRLSLFTAHPWLANRKDTGEEIDIVSSSRERDFRIMTPKLEITQNLIFEAATEGKKILVFSNYNAINEILFSVCNSKNISYWNAINGSTPQEERQEIINQFTAAPASAVLVLNPRAAGAGLNITAATVVIHFTPVWNPALEAQASARAHRRGQDKVVTIYKLYYVSTVEQVMIERSRFRKELGDLAVPTSLNENKDLRRALEISPITA